MDRIWKRIVKAALAAALAVGLLGVFGCADQHPKEYAGTWSVTVAEKAEDGLTYNHTYSVVLAPDGSFALDFARNGRWLGTDYGGGRAMEGTWSASGDEITCVAGDERYEFVVADGGTKLMEPSSGMVFEKAA